MRNDEIRAMTVPCKWCSKPTECTGTKLCDRCWELQHRIADAPGIAAEILQAINDGDLAVTAVWEIE